MKQKEESGELKITIFFNVNIIFKFQVKKLFRNGKICEMDG